jgi:hypothetical protein
MSDRKNYNSIVFLTTLSLYLGLVLAGGATPSVLAQAATTRDFDIKSEIVVEDDLDKKPDDKDCWDKASKDVLDLLNADFLSDGILEFVSDIQNLTQLGKYVKNESFSFQFDYKATEGGIGQTNFGATVGSNKWILLAASERVESLASNSFYRYDDELKANASHSKIKFTLENDVLSIEISKEKESGGIAEDLANTYNKAFEVGRCSRHIEKKPKIIYENSKAYKENNQVFIVTRLARASIDDLLAENNAR